MEINKKALLHLASLYGTPLFVYSRDFLTDRATELLALNMPFGFTPRFAMKANNHPEIIRLFNEAGLHFDASSSYEAVELLQQGIEGRKISVSSQQPAHNLNELIEAGVNYVATSMHQLRLFNEAAGQKGASVGLRVNPGQGSGHNNRTTTGGVNSSFGLWHEYIPEALAYADQQNLRITRLHVHVGSGADPKQWSKVMDTALGLVRQMPDVATLDIGGGYKVHRYGSEQETDMRQIARAFAEALTSFADETGRQIHLEVEPGTWLVAHAGVLLARVVDIVDTGAEGHTFLRLDTGMNDIIRPSMYGAHHAIEVLSDTEDKRDYVVVGHNCETGDILTPAPGDPEAIETRRLNTAQIGDVIVIKDTGAYCRSFAVKYYNSLPSAVEVFV